MSDYLVLQTRIGISWSFPPRGFSVRLWQTLISRYVAAEEPAFLDEKESHMRKLLVLACSLVLGLGSVALAEDKFPDISHDELKAAIAGEESHAARRQRLRIYAKGHIPGAIDFTKAKADIADQAAEG